MSKLDEQFARIAAIVSEGDEDNMTKCPATLGKYFSFLEKNITFPCLLKGLQAFSWEEHFAFSSGFFNKIIYKKLKQKRASYTDTFELIQAYRKGHEELLALVKRQSDNTTFVISLDWLKAEDEKSKNHQIIDDFSVWFVNY